MKYPANSLPTAVFVHGLFGPNDDISRIFLDHGQYSLELSVGQVVGSADGSHRYRSRREWELFASRVRLR